MKYDSVYFNNERYYDSTAGAAMLNIIREERKKKYIVPTRKAMDGTELFVHKFCEHYRATHAPRANGRPLKYTIPSRIMKYIKLYEYCMAHCYDTDFTVENTALRFGLGSPKKVEQCFSGNGDIGKIISCWNNYKATGWFCWLGGQHET